MAHLIPNAYFQPLISGAIAPGAKLYTYAAGTTTPLATYTDQTEAVANPNPIILDADGAAVVWLTDAAYKLVLKTSADVTIKTWDQVRHHNVGSIDTNALEDDAVTTDKIANDAVNIDQIADNAVTTPKIAPGALSVTAAGRAKMADGFLSADATGRAKMDDGFVNTAKILDDAVTFAKLYNRSTSGGATATEGHVAYSDSSGNFSTASGTFVDVTNLSVSLVTTGRPVRVALVPDQSANDSFCAVNAQQYLKFFRDAVEVGYIGVGAGGATYNFPAGSFEALDTPVAGTYTYKAQVRCTAGTFNVRYCRLIAYEL
jgi:hypothetical protein